LLRKSGWPVGAFSVDLLRLSFFFFFAEVLVLMLGQKSLYIAQERQPTTADRTPGYFYIGLKASALYQLD
jgi:hypothetical protein